MTLARTSKVPEIRGPRFFEPEGVLMDIPTDNLTIQGLPELPEGMEVSQVDVLVRLVEK